MGSICSAFEEKKKPTAFIRSAEDKAPVAGSNNSQAHVDSSVMPPCTTLDHPIKVSRQYTLSFDSQVRIDFSKNDYRAFCLLIHKELGAVLLHCTRKKRKPPHYQLPGGHVDGYEFKQVTTGFSHIVTQEQLYFASRIGCAREVYEETGMDFRQRLDRFLPMILYNASMERTLINEYKSRIFFVCEVDDDDFPKSRRGESMRFSTIRFASVPDNYSCDLMLQLSVEHSGFRFVKEASEISKCLSLHSGGKVEKAVEMAYAVRK